MQAPKIKALNTLFLPAEIETESQKLLVVFHGLGDSAEGYRFLPAALRLPEIQYLLVNAPNVYFTGFSWFDLYGDSAAGIIRSRKKIFTLLGELEQQGYLLENVSLLGFSQGCLMAVDTACRYPKPLASIVGISGFVGFLEEYPEKFSAVARNQRLLITHGTEDPMVPIHGAREQFRALRGMGLTLEWKEYNKVHTIDPKLEIEDIRRFLAKTLSLDLPR